MAQRLTILQEVYEYLKQNKKTSIAYVLLSFRTPIRQVLMPSYYGSIIETISKKGQSIRISNLKSDLIGVSLSWGLAQGMSTILDWMDSYFIPGIQTHIRNKLVIDIIESYATKHEDLPLGDIITRTIKLPMMVKEIVRQVRGWFLPTFTLLTCVVGYFTYLDPGLGLIMTGVLTLVGYAMRKFILECFKYGQETDQLHSKLTEEIDDILSNLLAVYTMDQVESELKRLEDLEVKMDKSYSTTVLSAAKFRLLINGCFYLMFAAIFTYSYKLFKKGKLSVKNLASITITLTYVKASLGGIGGEIRDFVFNVGVIKHTQEYLDKVLPPVVPDGTREGFRVTKGEVKYSNVFLTYPGVEATETSKAIPPKKILQGFNSTIRPGETVGIIGKIGSGKTSTIKLLLNLIQRDSGEITIDGVDVTDIPRGVLRREIMFVPQHPKLFNRSIYENIIYGLDPKTRPSQAQVEQVIRNLRLTDVFRERPLDGSVGKNGNKLSGGQKQAVALLRCYFSSARIVVLDEPTSSLDPDVKSSIIRLIERLKDSGGVKRTLLIITHDSDMYPSLDRVVKIGV